jgi:diacylglycerol kinase family enzyme
MGQAQQFTGKPPKTWVVICCEVAGKKTGGKVVREELVPAMQKAGITCEVVYTERKAHAVEIAKSKGGAECGLIAVGGDGTIHEVMDGLLEAGKLEVTPLGLLSQGTVNAYAISADLPDASGLPDLISTKSFRKSSLMHITDNTGAIDTRCFEAIYIGLGYNGTRGAQAYRDSCMGPMFGIIKANFKDNLWPETMAVTGKMEMVLKDGSTKTLEDTFYWIIVCMRNPYNGCLTDSMFVSYITLQGFPGFKRMVGEFLAPPFEFYSGLTSCFEGHFEVKSFQWSQTKPEKIGVCLDGDPTDMGSTMRGTLLPNAWTVCAPLQYPAEVQPKFQSVGGETEVAAKWIKDNPPPAGVKRTPPGTQPPKERKGGCFP